MAAMLVTALLLAGLMACSEGQKPGSCSPAATIQVCAVICRSDYQCSGENKCCPTACGGTVCSKPVTWRPRPGVKAGFCPSAPTGPWVCSNRCGADTDCRGTLKCCKNRCGALACQRPEP